MNPQKSLDCILAINVGLVGSGIGTIVSVPVPRLLIWAKLNTVNDCAAPTMGI